jgi:hypothetical protein
MSAETAQSHPAPASSRSQGRVEYLGFQDVAGYREYRLAVTTADGIVECRFRMAISAFGPEGLRLQDGPDVCYGKLLRAVASGELVSPGVVTLDDVELAGYIEAHTRAPRQPPRPAERATKPPMPKPRPNPRHVPPAVSAPAEDEIAAAFVEGQRVSHATYGAGVVSSSGRGHTIVCFDESGQKTFVTAMVELEVLSAAHTWETGPRGRNRLRKSDLAGD